MSSRNVTNIAQTGYVGKNLFSTVFAMARFELGEAIVSKEESSSDAGIGGYATWTKENRSRATLDEIWTESERKIARSAWEGTIEN